MGIMKSLSKSTALLFVLATMAIVVLSLTSERVYATLIVSGKNFTMHGAACKANAENAPNVAYGFELFAPSGADVICPLTFWSGNGEKPEVSGLTLYVGTNGAISCTAWVINAAGRYTTAAATSSGSQWNKTVRFGQTFTSDVSYPYDTSMSMFVQCHLPPNSAIYKLTWVDYD
jgi:hypothetical protein